MKRIISALIISITLVNIFAQEVGDPGVIINTGAFDSNYPQMERWANAGMRGGIPLKENLQKGATVTTFTSAGINAAINSCPAGKYVYLPNGTYSINAQVVMKTKVYLVGQSQEGVICKVSMTSGNAFRFEDVNNTGIYNITIEGTWGTPKYAWNFGLGNENSELPNNSNISVKFKNANDCFLDRVTILNSALHPVWINGTHITCRKLHIDGCHNKGGGAEGYLMVANSDNLITDCYVTHLRHISLQGDNSKFNVVFGNHFEQEVSFHSDDGGDNLIENNIISLPSDMWKSYYAIMGPWSTQHQLSNKPNYLYRNKCFNHNMSVSPLSPWSEDTIVYYGPHVVKPITHDGKINNFTPYSGGIPQDSTLYAVIYKDFVDVVGIEISSKEITIRENEKLQLSALVLPDSASNKSISWTSSNNAIVSVKNGLIAGVSEGSAEIIVKSANGLVSDTCEVTVSGILIIPVDSILLSDDTLNLSLGATKTLAATVFPNDAYDKSFTWSSGDTSIATVANGVITPLKTGSTVIVVKTTDGEKNDTCHITVSSSTSYIETINNMTKDGWGSAETYVGDNGFTWTVNGKGTSDNVGTSRDTYFNNQTGSGVFSSSLPGGISSFTVKCKAIEVNSNGQDERIIQLQVNDKIYTKSHIGLDLYHFNVNNINIPGDFTISITNTSPGTGPAHIAIDDISWTTYHDSNIVSMTPNIRYQKNLKVYPNPASDILKLSFNEFPDKHSQVMVYNSVGKLVLTSDLNIEQPELYIGELTKGLYTLIAINGEKSFSTRFVKN
ncbi:Ig-like domain-containing protein [Bacteroidales bacterium]|nr:Ig-like domain-containing protein [Bacteroidales bacterium]